MSSYSLSLAVKDFAKIESSNNIPNLDDDKRDETSSSYHQNQDPKLPEEMTQTLDLFRRYLSNEKALKKYLSIETPGLNIAAINEMESEAGKPVTMPRAKITRKFHGGPRPLSILERSLLPGLGDNRIVPVTPRDEHKNSPTQLTIFYAGMVNVYNDVPLDKAQAIMLLAGEKTLSAPVVSRSEAKKPIHYNKHLNLSSSSSCCKVQAGLPVARKYSLQRFLEKRRGRITNQSPYAKRQQEDVEPRAEPGLNERQSFTLLPFPSFF